MGPTHLAPGRFASGPPYYIITGVAQASVSRQSIEQALAALDALAAPGTPLANPDGDEALAQAVALARSALRQALAGDDAPDNHPVAILIADLSGYTAIAESMDAEQVREAMNAMWLELDSVIAAWGGRVDQHAGDSLVALFGLPWARPSDAWRAVQAAQALQLALSAFNRRVQEGAGAANHDAWLENWPGPQMRIGVHQGSVTMSAGAAAGDAVRIAYDLEEAAPAGATLVSASVRRKVFAAFNLQPLRSQPGALSGYLVGQPKPEEPGWVPGVVVDAASVDAASVDVASVNAVSVDKASVDEAARLVGRADALDALADAFERAVDAHGLEIITVAGGPGVGKSRLLHEFLPRLNILAPGVRVRRTQLAAEEPPPPYGVLRDLVRRRLGLYPAHSATAVRGRIAALGLPDRWPQNGQAHAGVLEQLLLLGDNPPPPLSDVAALAHALLVDAAGDGALIVAIDDLHHADPYSLALLDRLLHDQVPARVLVIALTEPSLLGEAATRSVSWLGDVTDPFLPASRLSLPPLSPVESRLMVADLLRPAAPLPQRLIDLIVADAHGNPWFIEEMIRHLIEAGIIMPGVRWRIDLVRAESAALPRTAEALIAARLAHMAMPDRLVLQAAADAGNVFVDADLFEPLSGTAEPAILDALDRLAGDGWLVADNRHSRAEAQGYRFARPYVRRAIAERRHAPAPHPDPRPVS